MSEKLGEFENASVGMICGVLEVLMLQPFNYAKNMVQQSHPISLNPLHWYRGVTSNCLNMGSCTMIQFAVGGKLKVMVLGGDTSKKLTPMQEIGTGLGAGMVSALAGSPLELIMIQQQRKGTSTITTMKEISSTGSVGRGFLGTAVREGLWTVGYFSIPPIVRTYLLENYSDTFKTNAEARIPAALLGGLFASVITHPFDTVKTCMQGDIERKIYGSFTATGKVVYDQSGIGGFYRGIGFRYGRMCIAVGILDTLREFIAPLLYPNAFK